MTAEFRFENNRCYKDKTGILDEMLGAVLPISYIYIFSNLIVVKPFLHYKIPLLSFYRDFLCCVRFSL